MILILHQMRELLFLFNILVKKYSKTIVFVLKYVTGKIVCRKNNKDIMPVIIIPEMTNQKGRHVFGEKWKELYKTHLDAYLGTAMLFYFLFCLLMM